jgi:cysteine desulfurase/selenocysteine lyase
LIKLAHEVGAITILDGAQFVSHRPVDVRDLDVDFLYFSAHKMLGPTGVGVLYGKTQLLDTIPPFQYGGDMILQVHKDSSTYHPLPEKFEAGTPNIAGVLGFGAALDYLMQVGMHNVQSHESDLITYTLSRAQEYPWLTVYGPKDPQNRGGIFSFNIDGIHSHDVGALLDAQGIAVRTGFHCAQPYMEQLGIPGTVRASYYLYNTRDEVDALFTGLEKARELFL